MKPPLVLSITARKGELQEMSTEKDETKQKPTSPEKVEAKEKPTGPEKGVAKKKLLEKMTVKELKEIAKEIPEISGVHGMKKDELLVAIKGAKGIKEEPVKKADASVAELKKKIKALKSERQTALEAKDKKMATIYKRCISRLKKKTRRVAA